MTTEKQNIFALPEALPGEEEFSEVLASGKNLRVERIVSHGHSTPEGEWYDQDEDEWVVLLQGEASLEWDDGTSTYLQAGDSVFIPAHSRHRVGGTTSQPPCVWLAVHGNMEPR